MSLESNLLEISVKDTGIGISKKLSEAVFEPFVQVDTSLTRKHQGYPTSYVAKDRSGLGLSICRELVRRMGGDIRLQSEEGKGTEIVFELPVTARNKSSLGRPWSPRSNFMTWSISPRQINELPTNNLLPITTIALYTRDKQTWDVLCDIFTSVGITVVNESNLDPMRIDDDEHDSVFIDTELFEQIPALCLKLLGAERPTCFVLFSKEQRGPFFSAVSEAKNVILVRRPLAIHRITPCFKEPWKYVGGHRISSRNSPHRPESDEFGKSSLITDRNSKLVFPKSSDTDKTLRWDTSDSTTPDEVSVRKRILMVEDNEINGKMGLKLLSIAGFDAELAENGIVALKMITRPGGKYDVVLMDCQVLPTHCPFSH